MRSISRTISRTGLRPRAEEGAPLKRLGNVQPGPLVAALVLAFFGILTVGSATAEQPDGFMTRQIVWVAVGLVALVFALLFDYHLLVDLAPIFYGLGLVALVLVLFVGHEAGGARSWFQLGPMNVQPAEFQKLATALLLARYLAQCGGPYLRLREILMASVLVAVPMVLIAAQSDLGSAVMFLPMLAGTLLVAGVRPRQLVAAAVLAILAATAMWNFSLRDYQRQRIASFLSPEADPLGAGYQMRQSKIAVGSGQWTGRGWGQGTQSQLRFLPERHSDFVMAVWAEERGFLGVAVVLALYSFYLFSAVQIAMRSRDRAGILLVVGPVSIFSAHVLYNTGMVVGLLPITGIPLPFLSYGGSFMLFNFLATSLLLNVDYRRYVNR